MAKKKKSSLKPVHRGFATTSVPKKVTEVALEVEPSDSACEENHPTPSASASACNNGSQLNPLILSPEEQKLQDLVESVGIKRPIGPAPHML